MLDIDSAMGSRPFGPVERSGGWCLPSLASGEPGGLQWGLGVPVSASDPDSSDGSEGAGASGECRGSGGRGLRRGLLAPSMGRAWRFKW